jgi:hypothetical protein
MWWEGVDWITLAQDFTQRRNPVNTMNYYVGQKWEFSWTAEEISALKDNPWRRRQFR